VPEEKRGRSPWNAVRRARALKDVSIIVATWVTIVGGLAGGVFALVQYYGRAHQERVGETLRYVERFDTGPMLAAWEEYDNFWISQGPQLKQANAQGEKALKGFTLQTLHSDPSLRMKTRMLIEFFDEFAACTCAHVCDATVAQEILGNYAFDLYGTNAPYIFRERSQYGDHSYGRGLLVIGARSFPRWRGKSHAAQCAAAGDGER
jgi:hypothetical protein